MRIPHEPSATDLIPIGTVAERAGIAVSAVRYYADRNLIPVARREGRGRLFSRHVLRRIAFIHAAQQVGLGLDEITAALDTLPPGEPPTAEQWRVLSSQWRPRIDEQIRVLEELRDQLDECIGCGCLSLQTCGLRNPADAAADAGAGARYHLDHHDDPVG